MEATRNMKGRASVLALAMAALCGNAAHADTAKEQELENRIQQLERKLEELTRSTAAPATTAPAATAAAATPAPAAPTIQTKTINPNAMPGTRFLFTGYVKVDALYSKYEDGEIADGSVGRDFYVPATIPVGGVSEGADLDAHAKQSRFIFGTDTDLPNKGSLISRLEFDLYGSALGDERVTNTYGLQLRQAYVQYNRWLFGQAWSNFQDTGVLPETADYIGPSDGTVFVRQAQVRYTAGNFSVSLENPETTLTPFGGGTGGNARISSDDNNVPDVTAAYTFKFGTSYLRLAGLVRQLKYETTGAGAIDDSTIAGALSLSGKFMLGTNDDLRFMITGGDGLGRYVGLNFTNDGVLNASGEIDAISGWAGFAAWRHAWNTKLRTTLMYSMSSYDNDVALTGTGVNAESMSWAGNLIYSPTGKLDVGVEFRQATRELESGVDGTMNRLQAFAKYSF